MSKQSFFGSIRGRLLTANGAFVLLLVTVGAIASWQIQRTASLLDVISSDARVVLDLSRVLDGRGGIVASYPKAFGAQKDESARVKFEALMDDAKQHLEGAAMLSRNREEAEAIRSAAQALDVVRARFHDTINLSEEDREAALLEQGEVLSDCMDKVQLTKIASSNGMERRLAEIKQGIDRPKHYLWGAAALSLVLAVVIAFYTRSRISLPVEKLSFAVGRMAAGEYGHRVSIESRDELGALGVSFNDMSRKLATTLDEVVQRNRDLGLVLDNVDQGFLSVTKDGLLLPEHSTILHTWFGEWMAGKPLWTYFATRAPQLADWLDALWMNVSTDALPLEVSLGQMPRQAVVGGRTLELDYKPIFRDTEFLYVLIVISDVTVRVLQQQAEADQQEQVSIFRAMVQDKEGLAEFLAEAKGLVDSIRDPSRDVRVLKREIHTLKGNCGVFGIRSVATICHEIESSLEEDGTELSTEARRRIVDAWRRVEDRRAQLSEHHGSDGEIRLEPAEHAELLHAITAGKPPSELKRIATRWQNEPIRPRLTRIAEQARTLARNLQKGEIDVAIESNHLRVAPGALGGFWGQFVHLLRNAVDHGLETPEERQLLEKSIIGKIRVGATARDGELVIEVADDGRGIDWNVIANRARSLGHPAETHADLVEALFLDGLTGRSAATEVSGRGIGMGAVRAACLESGGRIAVTSDAGQGTRIEFRWPISILDAARQN